MTVRFKAKIQEINYDLAGEREDFILTLKAQLEGIANIPPASQKWIFKGR